MIKPTDNKTGDICRRSYHLEVFIMCNYRKFLVLILIAGLIVLTGGLLYIKWSDSVFASKQDDTEPVFGNISELKVIPSGEPVGIYLKTSGVLVVDTAEFCDITGNEVCPAAGTLKTGDYITAINGTKTENKSDLLEIIEDCNGADLTITYERDGVEYEADITPVLSEDGTYMAGIWVKDDISGIGTITFICDDSYMALGHSVSDNDTGLMIKASGGGIYSTYIFQIDKSYDNIPGQLEGTIVYKRDLIGTVQKNLECGIYGILDEEYIEENYDESEAVYVASADEVHTGTAYICSRLSNEKKLYEIEITKINRDVDVKNIEFVVTDDELIALTGGIVQGMSGSPILQDGKLIGAVTHVLVDNSTNGYAIFAETMINQVD